MPFTLLLRRILTSEYYFISNKHLLRPIKSSLTLFQINKSNMPRMNQSLSLCKIFITSNQIENGDKYCILTEEN